MACTGNPVHSQSWSVMAFTPFFLRKIIGQTFIHSQLALAVPGVTDTLGRSREAGKAGSQASKGIGQQAAKTTGLDDAERKVHQQCC